MIVMVGRYVSEQPPYNLLDRRAENELIPLCQKYGLAVLPWSPLAMGVLAGRYNESGEIPAGSRRDNWNNPILNQRITRRGIAVSRQMAKMAVEREFNTFPTCPALDERSTWYNRPYYWSADSATSGRCSTCVGNELE